MPPAAKLRRLSQDFIIFSILPFHYCTTVLFTALLFHYSTIVLFAVLLLTTLRVDHARSRLHLENRPVLLQSGFYLFSTVLLYYLLFTISVLYYSTTDNLLCTTVLLYYLHAYYFTTTPARCISKTHLCMLNPKEGHKVCISITDLRMLNPKFAC